MKYVRTKDGKIYEIFQCIFGEYPIDKAGNVLRMPFAKRDIVSQADTIEKLCDEFVLINKNSDLLPSIEKSYHDFSPYLDVDIRRHEKPSYIEIYGSIWVDGNLIKVAKMNKKGELELL